MGHDLPMHNALNKPVGPQSANVDLVESYYEVYSKSTQKVAPSASIEAASAHQQEAYRERLTAAVSSLEREHKSNIGYVANMLDFERRKALADEKSSVREWVHNTPACSSTHIEVETELIIKKELAERMKVCERTIEVLCNENKIPKIAFRGNVRFKWTDVLAALENPERQAGCLASTKGELL
jgi:excisionase family DNA binding protein